jgi:uncharacterized protein (DUF58 family)
MPTTTDPTRTLLTPAFMHRLDRLDVLSRKVLLGKLQGERRSKKRGQSVEFADYRSYVVGDDLRFIDWNLYARLDKLFLRLFMEEEDLSVSIIVDATKSMDYGDPRKLDYVLQLAAALGYIGLVKYNRVSLFGFSQAGDAALPNLRGRRPIPQMLEFLENQRAGVRRQESGKGGVDLQSVCRRIALMQRSPGVVILVSDFFDKGDLPGALRYLAQEKFDTYAIQVLCPQEVDPASGGGGGSGGGGVVGDLRLRDIEDGDIAEVSVTPALLKRYKANLQAYCEHVREQCLKRGILYLFSDTRVPFETLVLNYLRRRGLLG